MSQNKRKTKATTSKKRGWRLIELTDDHDELVVNCPDWINRDSKDRLIYTSLYPETLEEWLHKKINDPS